MKKILFLFLALVINLGSLTAQTFNGRINPSPSKNPLIINSSDTLKILCALVEFQEDRFDQTYGSGKFGTIYTKDYGNTILDPLPHDLNYFSNHMKFAQNYYRKVSKGKANIAYDFLPGIITVSGPMREYSPSQNSETFEELGNLAAEVWSSADQQFPDVNYNNYDLFFVFHAGVGRDIVEVTLDLGRFDLPSLYLSPLQLKKIFGNDFQGFSVQDGNFLINNTAILPETESREIEGIGETVLLELTINGLIVSTIASHLGLPDLFNSETGKTAIGRFGLMDGQAFFAFNGLFPPEPSPWEKIYLGWEEPVTISPGNYNITLTAGLAALSGDTTIVKVPINSSEYFLIENRKRDALKNGAVVTSIVNGIEKIQTFAKDDTAGFVYYDVELIDGVVVDVDEFDWALPGFEDDQLITDPFEDMGIVIWHIDESIINSTISQNKINADDNNRGIKVVEADGIIDIGEEFTSIFGDVIVGEGTRQDTWYKGNPSEYYENKFTPDTKPNSKSNNGGNSLVNISGFSEIGNKMSFNLNYDDPNIQLLFSAKLVDLDNPEEIKSIFHNGELYSLIKSENSFKIFKQDELIYNKDEAVNSFIGIIKNGQLVVVYSLGSDLVVVAESGSTFNEYPLNFVSTITSQLSASLNSDGSINLFFGNEIGFVNKVTFSSTGITDIISQEDFPVFSNDPVIQLSADGNNFTASSNDILYDTEGRILLFSSGIVKHALTKDSKGRYVSIVLTEDGKLNFIKEGAVAKSISVSSNNTLTGFSVGDFYEDGNNYVAVNNGDAVEAYNLAGALADNFPFEDKIKTTFSGTPAIADINGDGKVDIITSTGDGRIIGFTAGTSSIVGGLNLSAGEKISVSASIFDAVNSFGISAINDAGYLYSYIYKSNKGKLFSMGDYGDNLNSSFAEAALKSNSFDEYFPEDKVYNWPNPVYSGETNIRFYVSEDSKVSVKIFDLAGDFVAELKSDAVGGLYNEIPWNVNDINSGVYFARVEAAGNSGQSASKIIKIAVIK